jgi:hypothetical protein
MLSPSRVRGEQFAVPVSCFVHGLGGMA